MPISVAFFFGGAPGGHEMLFVLLAILLLFGAKRLPEIARSLGRSMEEFRRAARDVTDEIMNADKVEPKAPEPLPPGESEPIPPSRSFEEDEELRSEAFSDEPAEAEGDPYAPEPQDEDRPDAGPG